MLICKLISDAVVLCGKLLAYGVVLSRELLTDAGVLLGELISDLIVLVRQLFTDLGVLIRQDIHHFAMLSFKGRPNRSVLCVQVGVDNVEVAIETRV